MQFAPLFASDGRARVELTTPCANSVVPPFGDAYRWVRRYAPVESVVYVFRGERHTEFLFCLWNSDFSNRVETAAPTSESAFLDLLKQTAPTILFLPRDDPAYRYYRNHAALFTEGFADDKVSVVVANRSSAGNEAPVGP